MVCATLFQLEETWAFGTCHTVGGTESLQNIDRTYKMCVMQEKAVL